MGLYNFQPRFVPFIQSGVKKHTIRATRKNPDKPGNTLYLYTGLRTKKAKLIRRVECVKVEEISIELKLYNGPSILCRGIHFPHVRIDDITLNGDEKESLARRDGFKNFSEMMSFWDGRLPFKGHIIHWK